MNVTYPTPTPSQVLVLIHRRLIGVRHVGVIDPGRFILIEPDQILGIGRTLRGLFLELAGADHRHAIIIIEQAEVLVVVDLPEHEIEQLQQGSVVVLELIRRRARGISIHYDR